MCTSVEVFCDYFSFYLWEGFNFKFKFLYLRREFPGGPVVRTRCSHCHGLGSISGWGNKIPQATQHGQNIYIHFFNRYRALQIFLFVLESILGISVFCMFQLNYQIYWH